MTLRIRPMLLIALLGSSIICRADAAPPCPDIRKIERIGKDLAASFQEDICANAITPVHVKWVIEQILPKMMNKDFLGVNPPPNWQFMVDMVINDCYQEGNLCTKTVQEELANCVAGHLPFIFLQAGPWITENCEKINKTVILNWQDKKAVVERWIAAFLQKVRD
ncbi:MAG: hypothetical protein Q8M03_01695 [Legionella sp.]|nr:hypothetical protein [Legionella sp.]